MFGNNRCRFHGGTSSPRKNARRIAAAYVTDKLGVPRDVEPGQALLEEVHRAAGNVAYLEAKIRELDESDIVWGEIERESRDGGPGGGYELVKLGAMENIWLRLYKEERKMLREACKLAIAAGIAERHVALMEQVASGLMSAMLSFARNAGLDADSPHVRHLAADALAMIGAGLGGGTVIKGELA